MGNFFVRLLGWLLAAVFVTSAHSETIPATWRVDLYEINGRPPQVWSDVLAYVNTLCAGPGPYNGTEWVPGTAGPAVPGGNALGVYCDYVSTPGSSAGSGAHPVGTAYKSWGYVCPDSTWTLSGESCTRQECAANEYRDASTGLCKKDCTGKIGQSPPNQHYATSVGGSFNFNGCNVKCKTEIRPDGNYPTGDGVMVLQGYIMTDCAYSGKSATQENPNVPPEAYEGEGITISPQRPESPRDCIGNGDGYILSSTGAVTCVPSSQAPAGQRPAGVTRTVENETVTKDAAGNVTGTTTGQTSTSQNPDGTKTSTSVELQKNADGSGVKTVKTQRVGANGEIVTETKTYNVAADGTETEQQTKTEKKPVDDYCRQNPGAAICKSDEKGSFGGSCEGGFTCTGDAATCAVARATHELKCQNEQRGALNDEGDKVIAGTDGKGVDTIPNELTDLSTAINAVPGGGAQCPPLPQIMGKTIEIDSACSILQGLGNAGVALSLLMAGFIVVGGIRGL